MKKKTNTENIAKRNISTVESKYAVAIDEAVTEIHEKLKELENTLKNTTDDNEKLPQK